MYYIKMWNGDKVVSKHEHLIFAKVAARAMGHTGDSDRHRIFIDFFPVAYVANEKGECVYNPRFPGGAS